MARGRLAAERPKMEEVPVIVLHVTSEAPLYNFIHIHIDAQLCTYVSLQIYLHVYIHIVTYFPSCGRVFACTHILEGAGLVEGL